MRPIEKIALLSLSFLLTYKPAILTIVKNQKAILVATVPLREEISSKKMFPKFVTTQNKLGDPNPVVVPRVINSCIVLKFGKPCLASKIKNGEKVIKKPVIAKAVIFNQLRQLELTNIINPEIASSIEAK